MRIRRGILPLMMCTALLTSCGSEYQPYTSAPEPPTPPLEALLVRAGPNSTGTGTVAGSGIDCAISGATLANTCTASISRGKVVTLTAGATGGSTFVAWGEACAAAGSSSTCTVTLSEALAVSASFAAAPPPPPPPPPANYTVTIRAGASSGGTGSVSGTGIGCAISGTSQSSDCSETFPEGTQLTLTAAATGGSTFAGWGGACAPAGMSATCALTVSQNTTVDASFAAPPPSPSYLVTVRAGAGGSGSGTITGAGINCAVSGTSQSGDCTEQVVQGTQLTLTAAATGGGSFRGWGSACAVAGTSASCTITVTQAVNVDASFAAPVTPPPPPPPPTNYTVTIRAGASSGGTGTVSGAGINCTVTANSQSSDCSETLADGTQLTLTATPTAGSSFAGWGGACAARGTNATCTLTVSQNTSVDASFAAPPPPPSYLVTVRAGAGGSGSGAITGAGINCAISGTSQSGDCSEQVAQGTQLTLTAAATAGGTFAGWSGACAARGTNVTCTITVSQAVNVDASFTAPPPQYLVTVAADGASTGTGTITATGISCTISATSQSGDCSESLVKGTQLTLTSATTGGSTFAGWGGACSQAGTATNCTITVDQAATVTANFTAPPPPNLAGFWSGSDAGVNIHYHITFAQSGATLSLASCVPGDCRLTALTSTGSGWLGASYVDIGSLTGTASASSITFTMNLGSRTVKFEGALVSPTRMVGQVSGPTMPAQSLSIDRQ